MFKKVFSGLSSQFKEFLGTLPPMKKASVFVAFVIILVSIAIVILLVSSTSYSPLLKNIPSERLALIVGQLQKKSIPFRLKDDGKTVLVPDNLIHATQMAIMSEVGEAEIGTVGLEFFEKQDLGLTSYAQRINFQRALQGELIRAVNTLSAVRHSKVILALPSKKTFLEEAGQPSASVVVDLYPGKTLSSDQVKGITYLISSAVARLSAERVTVVDSRGKVLSKNYNVGMANSAELIEMQKKIEADLEGRIESILSRVVGEDKVIARVNVMLSGKQVSTFEETVDADSSAILSSVVEEETLDGSKVESEGVPGVASNQASGVASESGGPGFRQNVKKEMKTTNFSVPKTTKKITEAAGSLQRISVAVLVDGDVKRRKGEDGKWIEKWVERTPEELGKYDEIVKNAIGFNASRGDSVKIENIPFQKENFEESDKILTSLERRRFLHSLFKWTLLGFSLLLFFFIVVRPFMRWVTDSFQSTVEDVLPRTIEELEELQSVDDTLPGMSQALPVLEETIDPGKAENELVKDRIMGLVSDDPEKAAGALSLWMARKEV